jgi:hypothetical protein
MSSLPHWHVLTKYSCGIFGIDRRHAPVPHKSCPLYHHLYSRLVHAHLDQYLARTTFCIICDILSLTSPTLLRLIWFPFVQKVCPRGMTSTIISIEECIIVCWFSATLVPFDFLYARPATKLQEHTSALTDLFSTYRPLRSYLPNEVVPPSVIWGCAMPWWQGTHLALLVCRLETGWWRWYKNYKVIFTNIFFWRRLFISLCIYLFGCAFSTLEPSHVIPANYNYFHLTLLWRCISGIWFEISQWWLFLL